MNKLLTILTALVFSTGTVFAQSDIVVGDMNDDGQLTIGDITGLTEAVVGRHDRRSISTKCDPNFSDPAAIAGQWRTIEGPAFFLTADGSANSSADADVKSFKYYPYSRMFVLINENGYVLKHIPVVRFSAEYLVLGQPDGSCATYYPDDLFAKDFVMSDTNSTLKPGETQQLSIIATSGGDISPTFKWTSSNPAVATVDQNGLVTAIRGGNCTITATAQDGSNASITCSVEVIQLVESIILSKDIVTLELDENIKLTATVLPEDAVDRTFTWSSSNPDVATVLNDGIVIAMSYGTSIITATANDGSGTCAKCQIIVSNNSHINPNNLSGNYFERYLDIYNGLYLVEKVSIEVGNLEEDGLSEVSIMGCCKGWVKHLQGKYNSVDNTINIPAEQYVGTGEYNGKTIYLYLLHAFPSEKEGYLDLDGDWDENGDLIAWNDLVYDVKTHDNGDVYFELQEGGWCLLAVDGMGENAETLGVWTSDLGGHILNKANWTAHYYARYPGASGWGEWEEKTEDIYVAKYDKIMWVNGFEGQFIFDVSLDAATNTAWLAFQDVFCDSPFGHMYSLYGVPDNFIPGLGYVPTGYYDSDKEYVSFYDNKTGRGKFYIGPDYKDDFGTYAIGAYTNLELWSKTGQVGSPNKVKSTPDLQIPNILSQPDSNLPLRLNTPSLLIPVKGLCDVHIGGNM